MILLNQGRKITNYCILRLLFSCLERHLIGDDSCLKPVTLPKHGPVRHYFQHLSCFTAVFVGETEELCQIAQIKHCMLQLAPTTNIPGSPGLGNFCVTHSRFSKTPVWGLKLKFIRPVYRSD